MDIKILSLASGLLLAGCSSSSVTGGGDGRAVERWDTFNAHHNDLEEINDEQHSRVVFIRNKEYIDGKAINIFVNSEYLASLLPGGYKTVYLCKGDNKLLGKHTDVRSKYRPKEYKGQIYNIKDNKVNYFLVEKSEDGSPTFKSVPEESINKENLNEQTHTLSRVDRNKSCGKQPQVLKKITLEAGALFKFDKHDRKNMLEKGKKEIINVANTIKDEKAKIDRIDVIGYTDPDGTAEYNNKLSKRRASSVRRLLVENGIPTNIITSEGRGETDLIIANCYSKHSTNTKARNLCNQPNRRVEIILYGLK